LLLSSVTARSRGIGFPAGTPTSSTTAFASTPPAPTISRSSAMALPQNFISLKTGCGGRTGISPAASTVPETPPPLATGTSR
jgi:hypothetical protein